MLDKNFQNCIGLTLSCSVTFLNTRHGFPTAITPSGIFLVTTLPAPITVPLPIFTPPQIVAFAPIHTSSPIVIGLEVPIPLERCSASIECPAQAMQTP